MRHYVDDNLNEFLEENIEAVIELLKKAYVSTKKYYENKIQDDFLYMNTYVTFNHGYCFYFARMLKSIYKNAKFVVVDKNYAHISHIYLYINGYMYDVNGKSRLNDFLILTDNELKEININHNKVNEEVYEMLKSYFYLYLKKYVEYNDFCIKSKKITKKN